MAGWYIYRAEEQRAGLVRGEAAKVAAERRGKPLQGFRLQDGLPGVFAWRPAPPEAGGAALLAYNKGHGALRWAAVNTDLCIRLRWCPRLQAARLQPSHRQILLLCTWAASLRDGGAGVLAAGWLWTQWACVISSVCG